MISHRFCYIDFKEVVIWSLIVRSDSCDWRCGRISCWAGFREKRRCSQTNIFPVNDGRRSKLNSLDAFMLKIASRWQSVNQWKSTTTATYSEESESTEQIASSWDKHCYSVSIQASLACIARLEPRLDELQYIINIQCQPYCTFVCFNCLLINILYVTIRLWLPYTPSTTQFERIPYSISSHLLDSGFSK